LSYLLSKARDIQERDLKKLTGPKILGIMKMKGHPAISSTRVQFKILAVLIAALSAWPTQMTLPDEAAAQSLDEYTQNETKSGNLSLNGTIHEGYPNPEEGPIAFDGALMFLNPARRKSLVEIGKLQQFHPTRMATRLLPSTPLSATVERQIAEADLNIGIEVLYFVSNSSLPSAYHSVSIDKRQLILYNILRSISTLQGLTYYSASRSKDRLLFEESWVIANSDEPKTALGDPIVEDIVPLDTILIHQKDKSFGSNQSKVTYRSAGSDMSIAIENLTPMRYKGLIRVVNPGKMQIRIIVIPIREGLLIYGAMAARTLNVKSFLKRAQASFTNRIIAVTGWYLDRIAEEFLLMEPNPDS